MRQQTRGPCRARSFGPLVLLLLPACSGGAPGLTLAVHPAELQADGRTASLTAIARDEAGAPGAGTVRFEAEVGVFDLSTNPLSVALTNGRAVVDFGCDAELHAGCVGTHEVRVRWNGQSAKVAVSFAAPDSPDAGDGGADAGHPEDAGVEDAGAGPDGGLGEPSLTAAAERSRIYQGIGDSTAIRAVLLGSDGAPLSGEPVVLTTNRGRLLAEGEDPGEDAYLRELLLETDSDGRVGALLFDGGSEGDARLEWTALAGAVRAEAHVEIAALGGLSYVATLCGGEPCDVLGARGSGWNEEAQVVFGLVDAQGRPAAGATVHFSIADPASGPSIAATAVTDEAGEASARVATGDAAGLFRVVAGVGEGLRRAESPSLAVRLARTSTHGMTLTCSPTNLAVYVSPIAPVEMQVACRVRLVDRENNSVPTGARVCFAAEAGTPPACTEVAPRIPFGSGVDEGTAEVVFETRGPFPASDTAPLPADPLQWPRARQAEPGVVDGVLVRNPRDGLVTLLAWVEGGEEFFFDDDGNGAWDPGERFVDQGEPFVDGNDDGQWQPGERYVDVDLSGAWDGPDGVRDADRVVWTDARLLYTARPGRDSRLEPADFGTVARGGVATLQVRFSDLNLNRPTAAGTLFAATHSATKGAVGVQHETIADGYGFEFERVLVDSATGTACLPGGSSCLFRTLFYAWSEGEVGLAWIEGAAATDSTPAQEDRVWVGATVLGETLQLGATGVIE